MTPRPRVHSLAIEVTAHCNQKCDYCYNEWRADNGAEMSTGSTAALLGRISRLTAAVDLDSVTLTGGEPFARKDIFTIIEHLGAAGVKVQMISNGGLITDAIAARAAALRVQCVQVTLNGPDAALHEEHVGVGHDHFASTLEGIRALRRHRVAVVGCVVVTRKNAHRVAEILELFRSLDVFSIALSRFSPAGYAASYAAALLPSRPDLLTAFRQAIPFATGAATGGRAMRISCTMPVPPCTVETEELAPIQFGVCPVGTSMQELALGPDGKLRNCTLHRAAIGGIADILDPSVDIAAMLHAPEIANYRSTLPAFCEGCMHASTCRGGCGAAAEWVLGSRELPDPVVWQHVDDSFAAQLARQRNDGKRRLETVR